MGTTMKQLEARVNTLNSVLGYPTEYWKPHKITFNKNDEVRKIWLTNPNHYYIGQAYGGYRLEQIVSESGAARDVSPIGTKSEIWFYVHAMLEGISINWHLNKVECLAFSPE
jgi:hypothetical protein